ncbi:YIP1 family protein [Haladaptatus cibarius]|uniref:YIP1 family protein n=1 Tax=Haladaptatus cibarius TaxID=453847 RepID=UPI000678814A|nr:YIP1 family protein [Haladaptatus cibarius]
MLEIFYDPNRFFEERTPLSVIPPATVVLLASLVAALSTVATVVQATDRSVIMSILTAILNVPLSFIWDLLLLGIYSTVLYVLASSTFEGDGSFSATIKVAGWGFLPLIFSRPLTTLSYTSELQFSPWLPFAISVLSILWQGAIWSFGLRHTHDLSRQDAAFAAGVPVTLMLALALRGVV